MADNERGDLFLCTENEGFYRIQLKKGTQPLFRDARVERLLDIQNKEVTSGDGTICRWRGQMLFVGDDRVWKLPEGKDRLEPFDLVAKSLPGRKIQRIDRSQRTDDYVWDSSRTPNAAPKTGFGGGRLYRSGRYEPLSHTVWCLRVCINSIDDEQLVRYRASR